VGLQNCEKPLDPIQQTVSGRSKFSRRGIQDNAHRYDSKGSEVVEDRRPLGGDLSALVEGVDVNSYYALRSEKDWDDIDSNYAGQHLEATEKDMFWGLDYAALGKNLGLLCLADRLGIERELCPPYTISNEEDSSEENEEDMLIFQTQLASYKEVVSAVAPKAPAKFDSKPASSLTPPALVPLLQSPSFRGSIEEDDDDSLLDQLLAKPPSAPLKKGNVKTSLSTPAAQQSSEKRNTPQQFAPLDDLDSFIDELT